MLYDIFSTKHLETRKTHRGFLHALLCIGTVALSPNLAQANIPELDFGGKFSIQSIFEDNADLGTRDTSPGHSMSLNFQPDLNIRLNEDITAYIEGRFVRTFGDDGVEDDTGQISSSKKFAELREVWVNFDHIGGIYPLSFKLGHQRIREDRSLFWNDDVDAAVLAYDTTLFSGLLGVVNNMASYRTSDDDYLEDDENRLRFLGEISWTYKPNHKIEFRSLYEHDYSGEEDIGNLVVSDNRDDEDYDLFWAGIRTEGSFAPPAQTILGRIKYRGDLIGVTGEETIQSTATAVSPDFRSVTGNRNRDVLGWALDAGVDIALDVPGAPVVTLNYAFGSGDDDPTDGTDNAYRDTDLNGNTSRFGLSSQSLHNYGEVFRPDLVNLHVFTAGVGVPVLKAGDLSFFYHHYVLDEKSGSLGSNQIQQSINNTSTDVGNEFDLSFTMDLKKQFKHVVSLPKRTRLRISTGAFIPGDAYEGAGINEGPVWRGLAQIDFKF